MVFNCRLASCCLDCDKAHMDVHNEIARTPGSVLMTTLASTLYCRHMGVCGEYQDSGLGDQIVLVPVNALSELEDPTTDRRVMLPGLYEDEENGDGINE